MVSSSSVWQQAVFSALWIVLSNVVVDVKAQGHLPLDVPGNLADHDTFGDLRFVSRMMVPYGPGDGYGFGMVRFCSSAVRERATTVAFCVLSNLPTLFCTHF